MTLLFNSPSGFVTAFPPSSKYLLISWLQSLSAVILEPKKRKCANTSTFFLLFAIKWWDWIPCSWLFEYWVSSQLFHSFTFMKRLFSSSSLSAIRVVSPAYLRLLMFFPAILSSTCDSSSPAFLMMYFEYKSNKQGDNIQSGHAPFPILNQLIVPCLVLTVVSWPAYMCFRRQVRWSGTLISSRIFHSLLWSTQSKVSVKSVKQMFLQSLMRHLPLIFLMSMCLC